MKISLVIPCYNEAGNIQKGVLDKIGNFTRHDERFTEILIVDDGSTDESRHAIKEYLSVFPKFKLIENHHQGKAIAVITGIQRAESEYVMFSDIDLATPLEESSKLIEGIEQGFEIVIGSRTTRRAGAPLSRKVLAVGFIIIRNFLIGLNGIKDTQCGFKIFQRTAAIDIIKRLEVFTAKRTVSGSSVSAGFDLEFLYLATKLKYKIKEVPVHWKHVENRSVNFIKDSLETLEDIARIKYYSVSGKYDLSR